MTQTQAVSSPICSNRAMKLALRVSQIANERGAGTYAFTLVVHDDGRWSLIPPPPRPERLG